MKKFTLLAAMLFLYGSMTTTVYGQCNFSKAGVELMNTPYTDPVTGNCIIRIDLYFDLQSNPGGKYVFVHIWPTASYPNLSYNNPPVSADLANSVATLGFYHQGTTLTLLSSYNADPLIPNFKFDGLTITAGPGVTAGYDRFEIEGLIISSPQSCSIPQSFTADAWESQSANAQNVHCFSKGLVFYANDPKITGLLLCGSPRTYRFTVTTINTTSSTGFLFNYNVYIDDGDGVFNPTLDNINIASGSNITLDNSNGYKFSSGTLPYLPYSGQHPYTERALWVVVTSAAYTNEMYYLLDNSCIPLPVQFKNFTAVRNKQSVQLDWTTSTEVNCKGFYVERRNNSSNWETIGYTSTKAVNGNSVSDLDYSFTDINSSTAVTEYRIRQTDLDAKVVYSDTRTVKGTGQTGSMVIYPNPSMTGQVNIVFDKFNSPIDIGLYDMTGRLVKQWNDFTQDHLVMNNIPQGIYTVKVWIAATREQVTGKLVVTK